MNGNIFFVFIFMLGLVGCGSNNIKKNYSFDDSDHGVVVLSVTHDLLTGPPSVIKAIFYMNGTPFDKNYQHLETRGDTFFSRNNESSEFENAQGRLYAIDLPPGKHTISFWKVMNGSHSYIEPMERPTPLEFEINSGEVKYVGNLHMNLKTYKNFLGFNFANGAVPEIRDESERDIAKFEIRFPQFSGATVKSVLLEGGWK